MQRSGFRDLIDAKTTQELREELENLYAHLSECGLCDIPKVEASLSHLLLQDQRTQGVIMDLALDAIVIIDDSGSIVTLNQSAEAIFGYNRDQVGGRQVADVIIPPAFRDQHHTGFQHYLATEEPRIINRRVEVTAMRSDGEEFPIELTVTAFYVGGKRFFTAFIRDISDRVAMERRLRREKALVQLLHRLTSLANEAGTTAVAMEGFLKEVCEYTGWPVGHSYLVTEKRYGKELIPSSHWYFKDQERFEPFRRTTERTVFAAGQGMPGRVLSDKRPVWVADISVDPNFLRAKIAAKLSIKTAFALPVIVGQEVVSVLEFFTPVFNQVDDAFLDALSHIGIELGRVIEREQSAGQLRYLADHDSLTGLPNLRVGRDRLSQTVLTGKRQKTHSALLYIDLDGFKKINDTQGHEAGDRVLKTVAKRISHSIRETDTVARIGGDEFFVILSDVESKAAVTMVAKKLLKVISEPFSDQDAQIGISASIGIALFPEDSEEAAELTRYADKAMYAVKHLGKQGFCFYSDSPGLHH